MSQDKSRFGTTVNREKLGSGASRELAVGDRVQLSPKAFLIVEEVSLVVAVNPAHPQLPAVRQDALRAGAQLTHAWHGESVTHLLHDDGDAVWSAVVQAAAHGTAFVGTAWWPAVLLCLWSGLVLSGPVRLRQVGSAALWPDSLPEPPQASELLLGPAQPPVRRPLFSRDLLAGIVFGFSEGWRDTGLAALLEEAGGLVRARAAERSQGAAAPVVVVAEGGGGGGAVDAAQLLLCILASDTAALRRLVGAPPAGRGAGAATVPIDLDAEGGPEDSDVTQEAEEDEEADDAQGGARGGGAGPGPAAQAGGVAGPGGHQLLELALGIKMGMGRPGEDDGAFSRPGGEGASAREQQDE
ncbi:hypothetical protein TSOC_013522, partial [Tetrabaena socialis]